MNASTRPLALALLLAAGLAHADDKRLDQAREALHRAQAALQSTQAQRDALQQEKARADQDRQAADAALAAAQAKARDAGAQRTRLDASLATTSAERDRLRAELEALRGERAALAQRLELAQAQAAEAQARAAEQRRTTQALGGLLQRSVQSLAEGEKQNLALYRLGEQAMGAYRQCELHGSGSTDGNLPGLPQVKLVNTSEQLRRDMDALATPATAAAVGTPPP
jgi:chromosome segregation ATPase